MPVPSGGEPERLLELLVNGRKAVVRTPAARWDADVLYDSDASRPGKANSRWGGYLDDADRFDAGFFGISPREAEAAQRHRRPSSRRPGTARHDAAGPRSDYRAIETYGPRLPALVNAPITVLTGERDPQVSAAEADAWGEHTTAGCTVHSYPGRHFFLIDHRRAILRLLRAVLAQVADR